MARDADLTDAELEEIARDYEQRGFSYEATVVLRLVRALQAARICQNCGCAAECVGCGPRVTKTAIRLGEAEERATQAEQAVLVLREALRVIQELARHARLAQQAEPSLCGTIIATCERSLASTAALAEEIARRKDQPS